MAMAPAGPVCPAGWFKSRVWNETAKVLPGDYYYLK